MNSLNGLGFGRFGEESWWFWIYLMLVVEMDVGIMFLRLNGVNVGDWKWFSSVESHLVESGNFVSETYSTKHLAYSSNPVWGVTRVSSMLTRVSHALGGSKCDFSHFFNFWELGD